MLLDIFNMLFKQKFSLECGLDIRNLLNFGWYSEIRFSIYDVNCRLNIIFVNWPWKFAN